MKTVLTTTLLISALTATAPAMAGDHNWTGKKAKTQSERYQPFQKNYDDRYYKQSYEHSKKSNKYGNKHKAANRGVIRLDIPVAIRGDERVHLRRLINRRSNVNLNNYRLKKVVVNNYARRSAAAKLIVGDRVSHVHTLQRGSNHIAAPRRGDGRWVLGVTDARIDNIRVVLEPKPHVAKRPGRYEQPWFSDRRGWNDYWLRDLRRWH